MIKFMESLARLWSTVLFALSPMLLSIIIAAVFYYYVLDDIAGLVVGILIVAAGVVLGLKIGRWYWSMEKKAEEDDSDDLSKYDYLSESRDLDRMNREEAKRDEKANDD